MIKCRSFSLLFLRFRELLKPRLQSLYLGIFKLPAVLPRKWSLACQCRGIRFSSIAFHSTVACITVRLPRIDGGLPLALSAMLVNPSQMKFRYAFYNIFKVFIFFKCPIPSQRLPSHFLPSEEISHTLYA